MRDARVLVLVGMVIGAGIVGGSSNEVTGPDARAQPSTSGVVATHHVLSGTQGAPDNTRLTGLVLQYEPGVDLSLANVSLVQPFVFRNSGTKQYRTELLQPVSVSINERTVRIELAGNVSVNSDDEVGIEIRGVTNPARQGPLNMTLIVNPTGPNRTTVTAIMSIQPLAPSLSNQGRVGSYQRIAIRWPAEVSGFLVARTTDGKLVGVTEFSPRSTLHADGGIQNFLNTSAVTPGSTIILSAHNDVDNDGTFDNETDPVFTDGGDPVSIRALNVLQTTTTTTTPTSTTTPNPTSSTIRATSKTAVGPSTSNTSTGNTPGFSVLYGMFGLVIAFLIARSRR